MYVHTYIRRNMIGLWRERERERERERYMYISDWALVRYLGFREKMRDGFRFWARWVKPDMLGYTLN